MEKKRQTKTVTPSVCTLRRVKVKQKNEAGEIVEVEKEVPPTYDGTITLFVPTYRERLAWYDEMQIDADAQADAESGDEARIRRAAKRLHALQRHVADKLPEYVAEIKIKRLEDGYELKSFDDLELESEFAPALTECVHALMSKHQVGKQ